MIKNILHRSSLIIFFPSLILVTSLAQQSAAATPADLSGAIRIDGSSTVYPISEAVAEEFGHQHGSVKITIGISGTGGGFKKFCAGETDISDASRPIKAAEQETCKSGKVDYIELPVAYDALTVVVNPKNSWATSMTVNELKKLWEPEAQGKVMTWKQIRASWPDQPIHLFGPGVDSGTYDYFTEAIVGKEHASRGDFTSSEDDNVLVQGVANDVNALGFFGMAYYEENQSKLRAVAIDDENDTNGKGPQLPSAEGVIKNTYRPLARPLFIYVRKDAAERPEVKEFISYYIQNVPSLSKDVGYIPLPKDVYALASERFEHRKVGSVLAGSSAGETLESLLKKESQG